MSNKEAEDMDQNLQTSFGDRFRNLSAKLGIRGNAAKDGDPLSATNHNRGNQQQDETPTTSMSSPREKDTTPEFPGMWICSICKNSFTDDMAKLLECEVCNSHSCIKCLNMPATHYKVTQRQDLKWICSERCQDTMRDALVAIKQKRNDREMIERIEKLTEALTEIKSKVDCSPMHVLDTDSTSAKEVRNNEDAATENQGQGPWKTVGKKKAHPLREIMKEAMVEQRHEDELQAARECNVMLYRVQESSEKEVKKRKDHDAKFFTDLCDIVLEIEPPEIVEVTRIGKPEKDKNRPLRIKFKEAKDKEMVINNARKLRHAEDTFKGISICEDLSKKDRDEVKALNEEAKNWLRANNKEGQMRYRIQKVLGLWKVQWSKRGGQRPTAPIPEASKEL